MQKYDEEDERWSRKKKSDNWDRSYHRVGRMNRSDTAPRIAMSGSGQGDLQCCRCIVSLNTELEVAIATLL